MHKNRGLGTFCGGREDLGSRFVAYAGSFPGREHLRCARNNQDGFAVTTEADVLVAVVTDGCGSGAYSEVGAQLGARFLAHRLPDLWRAHRDRSGLEGLAALARHTNAALADALGGALASIAGAPPAPELLAELGLFTWLAAVVDEERWAIIGLGDGAFALDGDVTLLESGPDNAPDYAAYRLVDPDLLDGQVVLDGQLFACGLTSALESLVVATDGLHDLVSAGEHRLPELALDEKVVHNPSLLHKRLRVATCVDGVLGDDTTLAVIRRRPS
jgi:hypothetical protein